MTTEDNDVYITYVYTRVYGYICACAQGYGYGRRDRGSAGLADRISATTVGPDEIGFECI